MKEYSTMPCTVRKTPQTALQHTYLHGGIDGAKGLFV